jgi:hypothetical protein
MAVLGYSQLYQLQQLYTVKPNFLGSTRTHIMPSSESFMPVPMGLCDPKLQVCF